MADHTPEDVERIIDKAKKEDREAKKARKVVHESLTDLDSRRNNDK